MEVEVGVGLQSNMVDDLCYIGCYAGDLRQSQKCLGDFQSSWWSLLFAAMLLNVS